MNTPDNVFYEEYKLKPNKRSKSMIHLVFFDTETVITYEDNNIQIQQLRLGIAQYYRISDNARLVDEIVFRSGKHFAEWLISKVKAKTVIYVMAHNIAFDFAVTGIAKYLPEHGFTCEHVFLEDSCVYISYVKGKSRIVFLDTFNYLRTSVKAMGKAVGLPKLDINPLEAKDDDLIPYCRRDVEIIAKFMIEYILFFKKENLGSFGITTPANAFNAFRHKFMKHDIYIHRHEKAVELERAAYFGGRTEAFYIGSISGQVWYLDINSMYPYVMKINKYPIRLIKYSDSFNDLNRLEKILDRYCCIAEVELNTNEPAYPLRFRDKTIFPTGNFITFLNTPELKYALEHNHIKNIRQIAVYYSAPIFTEYVEYFYSKREECKRNGDKLRSTLYKLLLNSLYGKFGQTIRSIILLQTIDDYLFKIEEVYNEDGTKDHDLIYFGNSVFKKVKEKNPSRWSFIAIASHVTAYARMLLWSYIKKAGYHNCFYCDTDSVFVNEQGYKNLEKDIDNYQLGKLSIEKTSDNVVIYGLKDYVFGDDVKLKGIKKGSKKIDEITFEQLQFPSMSKVIRESMINYVVITKQTKRLKRQYNKGIVSSSGWVNPYHFDNHISPEAALKS